MNTHAAKMRQSVRFASFAALALALCGCSQDMEDLSDYVIAVKTRPAGKYETIPPPPPPPVIPRLTQSKDPFESFIVEDDRIVDVFDPTEPPWPPHNPEELERFALDSLRMVGTLEHVDGHWGLVRDPGGIVHRVRVGNYIGMNYGKIVEVSEQRISLVEKVSDGRGSWDDRDAEISLSD